MTPQPFKRPKLAQWRYDRNLTLRASAELINKAAGKRVCSHETVRTICLPFGDPRRAMPSEIVGLAVKSLTAGDVRYPEDFVEPVENCRQAAA